MEEHDIMTALDNQQFAIWLQPQVACASGEICGAEVLLRQRQADGSWSLPPSLIERIESCGLIIPVGYWVMEEACRQLAAWQSQGLCCRCRSMFRCSSCWSMTAARRC